MKKFLAGLAMSAGLVSPAFALDNHVAWEGFLTVTASSAGCDVTFAGTYAKEW